ncbi:MAG: PD40 domain-containing protein [Bacteroidales bacterium]|nr:PD40 domain-containing protein [Bacteroidales bacterium]
MRRGRKISSVLLFLSGLLLFTGCGRESGMELVSTRRLPVIEPDYTGVTIPPNIAPMNFRISEAGNYFRVEATGPDGFSIAIKSSDGVVKFPEKKWRKLTEASKGSQIKFEVFTALKGSKKLDQYVPFTMNVSEEPADPYLAYRLIYPGYYNWSNIRIMQRSIESFGEETLIDNKILDMNCINCHSFNQYNPEKFMVHIRGSNNGTYIADNGRFRRVDPKIESMPGGATYPSWHPGGKYIAYSSNQVRQGFYARPEKLIEVFDLVSDIVVYDVDKNLTYHADDADTTSYLETFPSWSPDGRFLYFCRAHQTSTGSTMSLEDIEEIRYDIVRMPFDPETAGFGSTELVFNPSANGKSASFPRISPDGRYMVITLHDFGTFPIWHKEADLHIIDLNTGESKKMDLNSSETDSYHAWSSNGKWLVFSSKRTDGRTTRPFLAWFGSWDNTGKPFILPQEDPAYYDKLMESYNIPEFVGGRINLGPRDFAKATSNELVKALSGDPGKSLSREDLEKAGMKRNPGERSIHE